MRGILSGHSRRYIRFSAATLTCLQIGSTRIALRSSTCKIEIKPYCSKIIVWQCGSVADCHNLAVISGAPLVEQLTSANYVASKLQGLLLSNSPPSHIKQGEIGANPTQVVIYRGTRVAAQMTVQAHQRGFARIHSLPG